jgi:serine/threonine-protein kinase HipA
LSEAAPQVVAGQRFHRAAARRRRAGRHAGLKHHVAFLGSGLWEYLTYRLSIAAGIDMPDAWVLRLSDRGHTFAVRRFDRTRASRRHYGSAMTRLARDDSEGASYLDIVQAIEGSGASTQIGAQLEQSFRRVLFNVLIGNRDDHIRNHGFLREVNGWVLSPAFDVNPNPDKNDQS